MEYTLTLSSSIRECDSILHLGMAKEIYCTDVLLPRKLQKPKARINGDQLIPPSSSQKYLQIYL